MKKTLSIAISAVILISTVLSLSCKSEDSPAAADIEKLEWVLESYGESTNLLAALPRTEITLTFDSSKYEVRGNAGCNS